MATKKKQAKASIFGHFYTLDDQSGTLFLLIAASSEPGTTPSAKNVSVVTKTSGSGKTTKTLKIED